MFKKQIKLLEWLLMLMLLVQLMQSCNSAHHRAKQKPANRVQSKPQTQAQLRGVRTSGTNVTSTKPNALNRSRYSKTGTSTQQARIVSGRPTTINRLPYLVNLRVDGNFSCGGTLVRSDVIVTAAHCVKDIAASRITIQAGSTLLSGTGQQATAWKIIRNGKFDSTSYNWDVAVIKLRTPLTGANIRPIKLCSRSLRAGQTARISGWGLQSESGTTPSNQVRTTTIRMIGRRSCVNSFRGQSTLTRTMICAGGVGTRDTCSGDSGGPLIVNNELCGITSWGFGCGNTQYPGVYTSINVVKSWIQRAMAR